MRTCFWFAERAIRHHEGPAHNVQPRHAGRQGAVVRGRRSTIRVAGDGARCGRFAKLNAQHPAAAAEASWVVATDLAEALARNGTPFHQAHQIVGRLVLESVRAGKRPADWDAAGLVKFAPEFTPEMARLMRPAEGMKTREIRGGTGQDRRRVHPTRGIRGARWPRLGHGSTRVSAGCARRAKSVGSDYPAGACQLGGRSAGSGCVDGNHWYGGG